MEFENALTFQQETALQMLLRLGADEFFLTTKLASLNNVVRLKIGRIYEIDGEEMSGKSQICYSIAAKFLATKKSSKIAWISAIPLRTDLLIKHLDMQSENLDRIICNYPENIGKLVGQLEWIRKFREILKIQLIFVENIDALLHDTTYEGWDLGRSHQFEIVDRLNKIAKLGVTVVITNHVSKWRGYPSPALGNFWASQINNRFFIEKNEHVYTISTIRNGESQAVRASFEIGDRGISDLILS